MPISTPRPLVTPFYLHLAEDQPLPADPVYFLLARNDLFIGRNERNGLFQSLVPAKRPPSDLAPAYATLRLGFPKITAALLATIMAFFKHLGDRWAAEAILLLYLDGRTIVPVVPPQTSIVDRPPGEQPYPIGLRYDAPRNVDPAWRLMGSIHSHVYEPAQPSATDVSDEAHGRQGLHVIVNLWQNPLPEIYAVFVIDGTRFRIPATELFDFDGYKGCARSFPAAWLDVVRIEDYVPPAKANASAARP